MADIYYHLDSAGRQYSTIIKDRVEVLFYHDEGLSYFHHEDFGIVPMHISVLENIVDAVRSIRNTPATAE